MSILNFAVLDTGYGIIEFLSNGANLLVIDDEFLALET